VRYLAFAALARARLFQGDPDAALLAVRRALQEIPGICLLVGYAIISLVRLGRVEDVRTAVGRLRESVPNVRLTNFSSHPVFEPFATELNGAGLPE
jgi:hypothetical protein